MNASLLQSKQARSYVRLSATSTTLFLFFLFILLSHSQLRADQWRVPPERRVAVAIDGSAEAADYAIPGTDKRRIRVSLLRADGAAQLPWEAELKNTPVSIIMAPGDSTLVTMDRWGEVGTDPLIFYREGGTVLVHYHDAVKDILLTNEVVRFKRSASSFWWQEEAAPQFTKDGKYFLLWLATGRMLVFDSRTGLPADPAPMRADLKRRETVLETIELLAKSKEPADRIAAARFAGWLRGEKVGKVLRELANDPYFTEDASSMLHDPWGRLGNSRLGVVRRHYPVRKAAVEAMHSAYGQAHGVGAIEDLYAD